MSAQMDHIKELTDRGVDKLGTLYRFQEHGIGLEFTASDGSKHKPVLDCRYKDSPEDMDRAAEWFKHWHFLSGSKW